MESKKFWFFLGGADGEMVCIKDVLQREKQPFSDAQLSWNTSVEPYLKEIEELTKEGKYTPVLIELNLSKLPDDLKQYVHVIDHHGENSHLPTSLEQVAGLLSVELSRFERLIAANDHTRIKGPRALGATAEEVKEVLAFDRRAQGITPLQEEQAKAAAENHALYTFEDGSTLCVVACEHARALAITDNIAELNIQSRENILVISAENENDFTEINYFGPGDVVESLEKKYKMKKEVWSGGAGKGDPDGQGFVGGNFTPQEVEVFKNEAIGLLQQKAALEVAPNHKPEQQAITR